MGAPDNHPEARVAEKERRELKEELEHGGEGEGHRAHSKEHTRVCAQVEELGGRVRTNAPRANANARAEGACAILCVRQDKVVYVRARECEGTRRAQEQQHERIGSSQPHLSRRGPQRAARNAEDDRQVVVRPHSALHGGHLLVLELDGVEQKYKQ